MLRQYYWRCDSYTANRQSAANMKNPRKSSYWRYESAPLRLNAWQTRTASPISTGHNAAPIILQYFLYSAITIGVTSLVPLHLFFQNSPIILAVLARNGNMAKSRWNPNKTTTECPAPQSETPTLLLTPFLSHLSFRWTLPLNSVFSLLTLLFRFEAKQIKHFFVSFHFTLCYTVKQNYHGYRLKKQNTTWKGQ